MNAGVFWTVGHSTHDSAKFIDLLKAHGIRAIADVRLLPGSRRYPQFNQENLAVRLMEEGIEYLHFPDLGGRRRPEKDSPNSVWRNESFRGYADYMMTEPFECGMDRLLKLGGLKPTAILCAEALWWRCHRALISDWLKARGKTVRHIFSETKTEEHPFTSAARIVDGKLSYQKAEAPAEFKFE